jgi:hypothetical protein
MRIVVAITTFAAAMSAFGHHSVAMYDNDNLITLSGTVTKIEWTSPHVFLYFSTADEGGAMIEWSVELDPPVLLRRYGWRQQTVQPGDTIEFTGAPAKSGSPAMHDTASMVACLR